jgi:hypothetical protein
MDFVRTDKMAAEITIDVTKLPQDIRDKLAELELELSEGKKIVPHFLNPFRTELGCVIS